MDSRGIPIVIPAKKCNTTSKRITTPKRYDTTPLSPFFVRNNIKNELSLLDAYDDFYDYRLSSRYHPTSDDMRHNVRDLYKSNMFTEINSPKPPKRMRSSFFMDSDMMMEEEEEEDELLPHLEASKNPPKDLTVSSPMEAMTPLADDALDTLHDVAQSDLDLPRTSLSPCPATIPKPKRTTRATRSKQQETLVQQSSSQQQQQQQQQQEIVTPKSLLKHQKQVKIKSAPQTTPLPPSPIMPTRQKSSASLKPPAKKLPSAAAAATATPKPITHVQASRQRLTRRQARLIEENGGKPEFAVPKALPTPLSPPKRKTRASSKPKPTLPKEVQAAQEAQLVHEEVVAPPLPPPAVVDDDDDNITTEPAIIDQQQQQQPETPPNVVNVEQVTDVEMHDVSEVEAPEVEVLEVEAPEVKAPEIAAPEIAAPEVEASEVEALEVTAPEVAAPQVEAPDAVMEAPHDQVESNSNKAEKSEKELQEEKLRAYRKKKSDAEIKQILEEFPQIANYYQLIERAGSGTFSRVYKAKDLLVDEYIPSTQANKVADAVGGADDADAHYVAIKLIFDISTPERVANEIRCLSMLADSPGVTPLITAFRHEGLTFVVLPYIQFDHFDDFYRDMSADDVRSYVSDLLIGLQSLHEKGYMHRDVKPGNFLYNVKSKAGYLADFGLARASTLKTIKPSTTTTNTIPTNSKAKNAQYTQKGDEIGYYAYDTRSSLQADRSGTKGFRAPEVMLRYRYQTSAIDIWAVGVILLTILSGQYPIFEPEDDANGIIELAHVFGMKQLKTFTEYYGRNIHTNIPTIPEDPIDLYAFCRDINKKGAAVKTWDPQDFTCAVDLMKQCLQLVHIHRPTATDALNHPFFQKNNKSKSSTSSTIV